MAYKFFVPVLTVNYVVQDGKSNWLEGFILMGMFRTPILLWSPTNFCDLGLYLILAVTFWYYLGTLAKLLWPVIGILNNSAFSR